MSVPIFEVRIKEICIKNLKNVKKGSISLASKKNYYSDVLGLYGQNGSGKTTLIDAMSILKTLLCGKQLNKRFADYINGDSSQAELSFLFSVENKQENEVTEVEYSFCLGTSIDAHDNNIGNDDSTSENIIPVVLWEKFSLRVFSDGKLKQRMNQYINTNTDAVPFEPLTKYSELLSLDKSSTINLLLWKRMSLISSKSFIFSRDFLNVMRKNCTNSSFMSVYESIIYYGNFRLFIFDTNASTMLNLDVLPLAFNFKTEQSKVNGNIAIPINGNGLIPTEFYELVDKLIKNMNIVLQAIVPDLTVSVKKIGVELSSDGNEMCRVQLFSHKNSKAIPLCYESEGIKKIFSILQLLINVYNQYSFTVAIDELDSGVFEYLLGELLKIISNKGKGQLIFTSHNLRPLETLDKSCIAFTTTNSLNRYIRPTNIKATNNLRDYYYRDITIGEQDEEVYNSTNNSEIAYAFREAGEFCEP